MSDRMDAVRLCDSFGWDYEQYLRQPNWFVMLLLRKKVADSEYESKKIGKKG